MKLIRKFIAVAAICYLPAQVFAWGQLGHRVIGQVAESFISKKTKKEVRGILGHETLAMSSNWGDFIKSDPSYGYLYNWHFVNFPIGLSLEQFNSYLAADTITDAYTKINFMKAELKKPALSPDNKRLYLRMLVHVVGDIHQPMHTGHKEDLGGNKIELTWFGDKTNLHSVWDTKLIESQELSYTEYTAAINYLSKDQAKQWQQNSLQDWLYNSYQIGDKLYTNVKPGDKLSYKYIYDNIGIANEQLLKGGVHLAQLLDEIFG